MYTLEVTDGAAAAASRGWPAGASGAWSGSGATTGTMQIQRLRLFDLDEHAVGQRVRVTADGQSASVTGGGELRSMVLGNVGFSSGVHYWEVCVCVCVCVFVCVFLLCVCGGRGL